MKPTCVPSTRFYLFSLLAGRNALEPLLYHISSTKYIADLCLGLLFSSNFIFIASIQNIWKVEFLCPKTLKVKKQKNNRYNILDQVKYHISNNLFYDFAIYAINQKIANSDYDIRKGTNWVKFGLDVIS